MYSEACGASDPASTAVLKQDGLQQERSPRGTEGEQRQKHSTGAAAPSLAAGSTGAFSPGTVCPVSSVMALDPMPRCAPWVLVNLLQEGRMQKPFEKAGSESWSALMNQYTQIAAGSSGYLTSSVTRVRVRSLQRIFSSSCTTGVACKGRNSAHTMLSQQIPTLKIQVRVLHKALK